MNGCSARCRASRSVASGSRVMRVEAAEALSDCNTGLVSSRYQSQNSYHVNSYKAAAAKSNRYTANADSTVVNILPNRERIHRSATERESPSGPRTTCAPVAASWATETSIVPGSSGVAGSPIDNTTNRAAFHYLLLMLR